MVNCQAEHEAGHIPGAQYLDLQRDFSRDDSPFAMTLGTATSIAEAFAQRGVDDQSRVVLYSRRSMSWSTRFWWMLRWIGFDNASVLDGGFEKWQNEKRPITTLQDTYAKRRLSMNLRPSLFAGKEEIIAAIDDPDICIVNALGADIYSGRSARYGRPGRIPGSISIPQANLVDPETHAFKPAGEIQEILSSAGANKASSHITYCGGGIFATVDAFWLHQLGHENIAVYDNSMSEWGSNSNLPIEVDQDTDPATP